jgi:hypothetical protein
LFACDTGFAFVACLIASIRAWDWRRIPGRLLLYSKRSQLIVFDAHDAIFRETPEEG